ncbi:unnamed protein product [Linum trigynum]|uniref:Uncharacterized protein n=1 Tax=Linum trigynum TaxID=586398 RepID=A0AAV2F8J3_9ROSI
MPCKMKATTQALAKEGNNDGKEVFSLPHHKSNRCNPSRILEVIGAKNAIEEKLEKLRLLGIEHVANVKITKMPNLFVM